jgi:dipeptidyl aminopeptidase/acylaminoacyl peptidase
MPARPSSCRPAAAASCGNSRPVLLYAHGTSLQKSYDMADIANNTEARLAAAVFAAQGFIVVAPNYAGYGGSSMATIPTSTACRKRPT